MSGSNDPSNTNDMKRILLWISKKGIRINADNKPNAKCV